MVSYKKHRINYSLFVFLLCFPLVTFALNYAPWNEEILLLRGDLQAGFQGYKSVSSINRRSNYSGKDGFANFNFSIAPDQEKEFQIEAFISRTRAHVWAIDRLSGMGRLFWLDDALGDEYSLSGGLCVNQTFTIGLHDPSFFRHAHFEIEGHMALGKEYAPKANWVYRGFIVGAIGLGSVGSPYLKAIGAFEQCFFSHHSFQAQMNFLKGMGNKKLNPWYFQGYGSVGHTNVDLQLRYTYRNDDNQSFYMQILHRLYARQSPRRMTQYILGCFFLLVFNK